MKVAVVRGFQWAAHGPTVRSRVIGRLPVVEASTIVLKIWKLIPVEKSPYIYKQSILVKKQHLKHNKHLTHLKFKGT